MRNVILVGASALALLGCDLLPPLPDGSNLTGADSDTSGLGATSTSGGVGADTLPADGDTLGATSLEPPSGSTSSDGATTDDPPEPWMDAGFEFDVPERPPEQMCHALPMPMGPGPTPVWCDEWVPEGEDQAYGNRVAVGPAGEIYVTGRGDLADTSWHAWLARYSPDGVRLWAQPFSHGPLGFDTGYGVDVAPGGDVLVGGTAAHWPIEEHGWIARLTADGELLWDIDQPDLSNAWRIGAHEDGTFVVVGSEPYFGIDEPPAHVTRHAADGSQLWLYGPTGVQDLAENLARGVAYDGAGNLYFTGGLSDHARLLSKLAPDGGVIWELALESGAYDYHSGADIAVTESGDVFVGGYIDHGAWMARFTTDGAEVWSDVVLPGDSFDAIEGLALLPDGDVVVVGIRSDAEWVTSIWLRRYTPDGDVVWDYTVPGEGPLGSDADDVVVTPEGDIVVVGTIYYGPVSHLWVARFEP